MIYMDNAATTMQKPQEVIDAVVNAMGVMGNAGRGAHAASLGAARIIYETREKLSDLFGAENPKQIAFTSNSTEALNIAIKGVLKRGDHVITTMLEHNSVLRPLYEMEQEGVELTIVRSNEKGILYYEEIEKAVKSNTRAVVCTAGSNLTGNLTDLEQIGRITKRHQLLWIVDASQPAGIFPLNVKTLGIDILCFTGHKSLLGPQGTGGIYVREGVEMQPLKSGGSGIMTYQHEHPVEMPERLEAGTLNGHGISGLCAALTYIEKIGMEQIREKELSLMRRFYEGMKEIKGVKIYGDFTACDRCPIVTINIGDYDSAEVSDELLMTYGISTRPGGHCAPLMHKALGTVEQGAVRFSFSHFNSDAEIDAAVKAVGELAK